VDQARVERHLRVHTRLQERAHNESAELKPFGYALKRQGLDRTKLYASPDFIALPFDRCEHLGNLTQEQLSVLTGLFYGNLYSRAASAEWEAIRCNMSVAERVFKPCDDGWMILCNETGEEYDHLACFRAVYQTLTGNSDIVTTERYPDLNKLLRVHRRAAEGWSSDGYGALYLLVRYLLNLSLKEVEGFVFEGIDKSKIDPLVLTITECHRTDEARHMTTSVELGHGLFKDSKEWETIRGFMSLCVQGMISNRFSTEVTLERYSYRIAYEALELALARPEFAGMPTLAELERSWSLGSKTIEDTHVRKNAKRWLAKQIADLIVSLDLDVQPLDEAYERFQDHLQRPSGAGMAATAVAVMEP